ncbi:MAG TPA: TetR/AcrR family transcriptional regulator [Halanaerobiales bacterium]|nr:TetR/AcrR family transcriptional regulator [Halanaerobiales bacterium]
MTRKYELFDDLEDKKSRICVAAINLFSKKSFNQTTVEEIARETGVGKGTFYNYFESKEYLLNFLLDYGTVKLINYVKDSIKEGMSPKDKMETAIDSHLQYFGDNHDYFVFYLREMWSYREGLEDQILKLKEDYITIFEDIIKEGKKEGLFKDIDTETIGSGLFGLLSVASSHWALFSSEFPIENIDRSVKEVFFNGLLRR